jgi:hypothetical protein
MLPSPNNVGTENILKHILFDDSMQRSARHAAPGVAHLGCLHARLIRHAHPAASCLSKRVDPSEVGKSREVAIRRTQKKAMFDREGGNMRICHKIAMDAPLDQQAGKYGRMALCWRRYPDVVAGEPSGYLLPGFIGWGRGNSRGFVVIRRNASKHIQGRPICTRPFICSSSHARAAAC